MAHPNEDLIRRGYEAFSTGDMETIASLLSEDVVYHIGGSSQLAGDYRGPQEVIGLFIRIFELSGGTFHIDLDDVLANDVHGVGLYTGHGEHEGRTLESREVNVFRLADGKVTEIWNYVDDQDAVDRFFG
jgi:uncharacterized protein